MVASFLERPMTRQTAEERIYKDALRTFQGDCTPDELKVYVSTAITSLWTEETRVTTFIPVLAMREIRELLAADHHPDAVHVAV